MSYDNLKKKFFIKNYVKKNSKKKDYIANAILFYIRWLVSKISHKCMVLKLYILHNYIPMSKKKPPPSD